jgi:lipoprotein-releasing system ATP-binding protein
VLKVTELRKEYATPRGPLTVLEEASFSLQPGEAASIMGPSGSGKSTLLYILGALEQPSSGSILLDESDPFALSETDLAAYRNSQIGFVFQDHCLLPQCSVIENVLVPTLVSGSNGATEQRARGLLEAVGLSERISHRPAELSGGEKQRVAIARALIHQPRLLLCDEPTGNLDRETADSVASLLLKLHEEQQSILLVVTHSQQLADRFAVRFGLIDRRLQRAERK